MKSLKSNLTTILMIAFEIAVGVLLLVDPEGFTTTVIIIFGATLLVIGAIFLFRYLGDRKEGNNNVLAIFISALSFIAGIVFTFFSGAIIGLITAIAVVYGIIIAVSGGYKLYVYFLFVKSDVPVSKISIISSIFAIVLGIVIIIYPKDWALTVWQLAGILLLVESAIDIASMVQTFRIGKDN